MRDPQIRRILKRHLKDLHKGERGTRIVDEMPLCRQGRADVAVVNGSLWGYEIKSTYDTTNRLPIQVPLYESVFDYSTVVVAPRHLKFVTGFIPRHWGITALDCTGTLVSEREPSRNPNVSIDALIWLVWKSEALQILRSFDLILPSHLSVSKVWDAMRLLPREPIAEAVRTTLKRRGTVSTAGRRRSGDDSRSTAPIAN